MSLFRTGFYFKLLICSILLFGCINQIDSVWDQINKIKPIHENEQLIVCGISNNDCILCTGVLKSQLGSLCSKYKIEVDSILFVSPEMRRVEIDYLFFRI